MTGDGALRLLLGERVGDMFRSAKTSRTPRGSGEQEPFPVRLLGRWSAERPFALFIAGHLKSGQGRRLMLPANWARVLIWKPYNHC